MRHTQTLDDGPEDLSEALRRSAASWWQVFHFGALALVIALSPSTHAAANRNALARHIHAAAWRVIPWFTVLAALLSLVVIRIVVVTSISYGLSQYALGMVVRVLVVELIPLAAALFVALRSGSAITAEIARMVRSGELETMRREGGDPVRQVLVPRVIGSAVSVVALAAISCAVALVLAYFGVYGFSPWGLPGYTHAVGQIFDPVVAFGLILKTFFFSLAVAVIPVTAGLETPRAGSEPVDSLRGMVRLFLVLMLIEGGSLAVKYI